MKCNECYQSVEQECKGVCDDIYDADCIFYNTSIDSSKNLKNLGVKGGASFSRILQTIDRKFGEAINASFSYFKTADLSNTTKITTQKQFVESVNDNVKRINEKLIGYDQNVKDFIESDIALDQKIIDNNKPELTESALNINNTDTIKQVLTKIIVKLLEVYQRIIPTFTFKNSDTTSVQDTGINEREIKLEVKISDQKGNLLSVYGNGLFVALPSSKTIIENLSNSEEGKRLLFEMINKQAHAYKFVVENLSESSTIVEYYNSVNGDLTSTTIGIGEIKQINNVREMITNPNSRLRITFKGV